MAQLVATARFSLSDFHIELADVEKRELEVYVSREEIPDPTGLSRAALNPTLQIVATQFPVGSFIRDYRAWQSGAGDEPALPDHPRPETIFLLRHPESLSHQLIVADDALLFAFKVVADDIDIAVAASTARVPITTARGALLAAARAGLILISKERLLEGVAIVGDEGRLVLEVQVSRKHD